jgi:LPS-assembly protein
VFSPRSGLEKSRSDYVLGAYLAPTEMFRILSQTRFDVDTLDLNRADIGARFAFGGLTTQAIYTYQETSFFFDPIDNDVDVFEDQQSILGSVGLKLSDHWTVFAAVRYDLDEGTRLTDSIQLRYGDDCFAVSLSYSENFIVDPLRDLEEDQTVMVRFEFKNLGEYKYKTDALDHVYGTDEQTVQ